MLVIRHLGWEKERKKSAAAKGREPSTGEHPLAGTSSLADLGYVPRQKGQGAGPHKPARLREKPRRRVCSSFGDLSTWRISRRNFIQVLDYGPRRETLITSNWQALLVNRQIGI